MRLYRPKKLRKEEQEFDPELVKVVQERIAAIRMRDASAPAPAAT
jgi:hypothetical protein